MPEIDVYDNMKCRAGARWTAPDGAVLGAIMLSPEGVARLLELSPEEAMTREFSGLEHAYLAAAVSAALDALNDELDDDTEDEEDDTSSLENGKAVVAV